MPGSKVRLLYPARADRGVVETVEKFLVSLGMKVQPEVDQDEPLL